eukprot:CAMPEP_0185587590 /NCGR_PEP_ID=MMETSP0434-20130131/49772_1 /TAXON_ID=626734 ORGANISM="Favella taraikaensis, Strain Fe Narragansett Bay" /NCGR_SAMPLE_ID=MMETSP0434 /ASSEMBLY_ACC=CAM_ASM_000379 /LENGTH=53 /DNA_ID=CAMNT_0028209595 /DNA_START=44 /DNA_END=202 /DNA_ORIENTATION=-
MTEVSDKRDVSEIIKDADSCGVNQLDSASPKHPKHTRRDYHQKICMNEQMASE